MTIPEYPSDVTVVDVTPAIAAEWLARNDHNRNLREWTAQTYATDMANGDWRWTGETIKFAADGTLIDGQHRLRGVIIADVTVPMLVVGGLKHEAQEDVDRGLPRKFSDVLQLRGEISSAALAALIRRVHGWNAGQRKSIGNAGGGHYTVAQMLRTLDAHPELRDIVRDAHRVANHCDLPGSVVGIAWWVFDQIDSEDAAFFFERLADGQAGVKGDPIYELRRMLHNLMKNVRGERSQSYLLAVTIKAWNAYRRGDQVGVLRWLPGGAKPEAFPEPE